MSLPRTILIIEDDLPFAEFLRAAIESLGHRAVHVGSGAEATEAFQKHQPDLVFLDLLLPKKDGFKVAEEIRSLPAGADVPIAMMTGIYRKAVYEKEGREKIRAVEYLLKPFGVREIWRVLERHVGAGATRVPEDVATPATRGTSLENAPLASQLSAHLGRQSDGVMFVRGAEGTFVIYLRAGEPIFARSSNACDRLDRVLVKAERATEAQIAEALQACSESRGKLRLGEALVERGVLSREEVTTALQLQLRLILNRAFQVESGHCLFVAGEHPTEEDVLLAASAREVVLRGARVTACESARRWLPAGTSILSRPNGWESLLPCLNLRDDEAKLLQLADGATSVERFLACAAVAGLDGPRILLGLSCAGLVNAEAGACPRDASPATEWDARAWRARPIGAAIAELHHVGATGRLTVQTDTTAKMILDWRRGEIVAVRSANAEHRLGPMIERMALLDAAALETVTSELGSEATDLALARALVDRGLLGPAELYWAAVYQAHGAVHSLLGMGTLPFAWSTDTTGAPAPLPDVPTIELAWNGIRSLDDGLVRELLCQRVTDSAASIESVSEALPALPLDDHETAFAAKLVRGLELGTILAGKDEDGRRTALGLVWLGRARAVAAAPKARKGRAQSDASARARSETPRLEAPPLPLSDDLEGAGDFLDMLHGEAFLTDEEARSTSDAELLESRLSPPPERDETVAETDTAGGSAVDISALATSITLLARRLNDLRPTVRTLRGGLDGKEQRVLVDRARMAELFDGLLDAIAATSQVEDLLERWQAEGAATAPEAEAEEPEPVAP